MNNILTLDQVVEKYEVSSSSLLTNFPRTQKAIAKKYGVQLEKIGRGKSAEYHIIGFDYIDPNRAVTLYQSLENNLIPTSVAVGLLDLPFLIFVAIVSSPQRAFRGSYIDLLNYIEVPVTTTNLQQARSILQNLEENNLIMYVEDKTDTMYFLAGVNRKTETDMSLEIEAILYFKQLVSNTRKSWIPLMKVYLALHFLEQPCTIKQISAATQLSEYKVRDSLTMLAKENIIIKEKVVHCDAISQDFYCLGTQIDVNAFGLNADLS